MRVVFVGPGQLSIPPQGWGAVESLIWDLTAHLRKLKVDVLIVNVRDKAKIVLEVNNFIPDIVHIQYDEHADIVNKLNCKTVILTSHYAYIATNPAESYKKVYDMFLSAVRDYRSIIFALSPAIARTYICSGVPDDSVFVTPNGADEVKFRFVDHPCFGNSRSIYLAKIEKRKRQSMYQQISSLFFAGNCIDKDFDCSRLNYLGEWSKQTLYDNLTHYGNLVLLSDGEAHPLVVCEALICGLGLVLSSAATANLDLTKPWIEVISESKWNDTQYVEEVIVRNRLFAVQHRNEIRTYGLEHFSWTKRAQDMLKIYSLCMDKKTKEKTTQ